MRGAQHKETRIIHMYIMGFAWSVVLTIGAYLAVVNKILSANQLIVYIMLLALLQVWVQLYFFLHLGKESRPRWNLWIFLFMVFMLLIIVVGSLWIMHNLNYNMMPPHQTDHYMIEESNEGF